MTGKQIFSADWPVPRNIHASVTTKVGGISEPPYKSFNLANHVGDTPLAVARHQEILQGLLPSQISCQWLDQEHGTKVVTIESAGSSIKADGLVTQEPNLACCILTADCLPILFSNQSGTEVAAAHGGWRGLYAGIVENILHEMQSRPEEIVAWLGPAIGPCHYQVGIEIREAFLDKCVTDEERVVVGQCFTESDFEKKVQFNLYAYTKLRLTSLGVADIHGGHYCTYCAGDNFYSYRRDGKTGRMASIIFMAEMD